MLEQDPLAGGDLAGFAKRFRSGVMSSEQATKSYLARIEALDVRLGAYEHVAADQALATARAMDALYAAGTDLGPLMGVPIAAKDVISVDGMPTRAGTRLDVADLIGPEGPVIKALRRAGCVILGKTKPVEFAFGITGLSQPLGTPVNPWDAGSPRLPGGSSSGSGVAAAAGLCAFALGTDTGGSIRIPAAVNGVFGLKTSFGRLSNDGAFALARHLDTIGLLTRSAEDAAIVYGALMGYAPPPLAKLNHLGLGRPDTYFFDGLDPDLEARVEAGIAELAAAGALTETLLIPEAPERENYFPKVLPVCLLAELGRDRFLAGRAMIDPIIARRIDGVLKVSASDYVELERRRQASMARAVKRFEGFDAWISPTTMIYPPTVESLSDPQAAFDLGLGMTRNTQPANYLDLCAASIPLPMNGYDLPAGLQIMCPPGQEYRLLSIALAIEARLGRPRLPKLEAFLRDH